MDVGAGVAAGVSDGEMVIVTVTGATGVSVYDSGIVGVGKMDGIAAVGSGVSVS